MIWLAIACWILAAICNAVMDVLAFKFKRSIFRKFNPNWWNPSKSWKNKYKGRNPNAGPAFVGSTTFLSFITDAWHLFQFGMTSFIALSLVFTCQIEIKLNLWLILAVFAGLKISWGVVFELFYGKLFRSGRKS